MITIFFPKKGSKIGRVVQLTSIGLVIAGSVYFYIQYRNYSDPLIEQGRQVGLIEGSDQEASWCLSSAQTQFMDDNLMDGELKLIGYTEGCLQASNNVESLCAQLPKDFGDVHRLDVVGKSCGVHGVCEDIYEVAAEFCGL